MTWIVSGVGCLVSVAFMITAGVINWRYGLGLGRTDDGKLLFAAVAAFNDTFKVLLPFIVWWSFKNRRWIVTALGVAFLVGCLSYSVVGIAGFVDMNLSAATGRIRRQTETRADLRRDLGRKQKQLVALGIVEPPSVIEERLQGLRQDRRWTTSEHCRNATVRESRSFCITYHALEAQRANGLAATKLERDIIRLRQALDALSRVATIDDAEPRLSIVSRVTGWALISVQTGLSLLLVATIEGASTFGMFISLNHGELRRNASRSRQPRRFPKRRTRRPNATRNAAPSGTDELDSAAPKHRLALAAPEMDNVKAFAVSCLRPQPGASTEIGDVYQLYQAWCRDAELQPLPGPDFHSHFLALCDQVGFNVKREGERVYCIDLGTLS